jgi:hypothetical protein
MTLSVLLLLDAHRPRWGAQNLLRTLRGERLIYLGREFLSLKFSEQFAVG